MIFAPRAVRDLAEIKAFIALDDETTAERFIADLSDKIFSIARNGLGGVSRSWIRPGLRMLPYRNRCIYFRIEADTVIILRILHGRQDVSRSGLADPDEPGR